MSSPDRCLAHFVLAGQLGHRLARGVAFGDLSLLTSVKGRRPAELLALCLGPLNPFLAALADQATLELGDPSMIVIIDLPTSLVSLPAFPKR